MRKTIVGLMACALLVSGTGYAQAAQEAKIPEAKAPAQAQGSLGQASLVLNGTPRTIPPLARCATGGVTQASSPGASISRFVEFGSGTTRCSVDPFTGYAKASVTGSTFRLSGLQQYGGPSIRLASYTASCETTDRGSSARFQLTGLTGITVPSSIPANHVIPIHSHSTGAVLATATFNETIVPSPPDGSMKMNMLHIRLFPQNPASPTRGDILVGPVACDPY